jgi:DNA-binding MarR family transcriptional regulator
MLGNMTQQPEDTGQRRPGAADQVGRRGGARGNGQHGGRISGQNRTQGRELRDEVDDLVAAWRTERPDLDVAPLQVLSRISRLAKHLDRARRTAFAAHGLESWEFDVLSALRRQGPPYQLSPGGLLRATLVTSGTMTNRIDRLATAGLVRRHPDPQDKRGVLVALTDDGRSRVDAALADLLIREEKLLAGLMPAERQVLAGLLRVLLAPFDAHS